MESSAERVSHETREQSREDKGEDEERKRPPPLRAKERIGFFGPISNISVLSEFNRRKLLVIQSFIFLTHSVSLDSLEVSSGFVEIYS